MLNFKLIVSICLLSTTLFANIDGESTAMKTTVNQVEVQQAVEQKVEEVKIPFEQQIKGAVKSELNKKISLLFLSKAKLRNYYSNNNFQPFWFNENGIKDISLELLDTIKNDPVIKPNATNAFKLNVVLDSLANLDKSPENYNSSMLKIDFMLTEIYDKYMGYLANGTINWRAFQSKLDVLRKKDVLADWEKVNASVNSTKLLVNAINENNLKYAFDKVNFTYPNSDKLINAIQELQKVVDNGDYTKIPAFDKALKPGDKSETIRLLRKRLFESKDLETFECIDEVSEQNITTNSPTVNDPLQEVQTRKTIDNPTQAQADIAVEVKPTKTDNLVKIEEVTVPKRSYNCERTFDEELKNAVISFQKNHGLTPDGVVGPSTRAFLNLSAKAKIEKIRLNLERMRWLPRDLGEKFLIVNIPDYKLKMYDKGQIKLDMNVVVGEQKHPTPIFSNEMSYIVLNPYWRIPKRIAQKELIPKLAKNPNYLNEKGIRVHEAWDPSSMQVDTFSVNWQEYYAYLQNLEAIKKRRVVEPMVVSEETMNLPNLKFIQVPSNTNPLGKMKFMFPNKYQVYMHDTNAKSLFSRSKRVFSHGCIRLSRPSDLLKTISEYDMNVNYDKATEVLKDIEKKDIGLKNRIPVHIVYLTSWVDENGKLQFRDDVYKYDKMQEDLIF